MAFLGDLGTGHKYDLETFKEMISDSALPTSFSIMGNHDLFFDSWSAFKDIFGTAVYCFIVKTPTKKDLYLCLDSASGTFGDDQIEWLKNMLKNARSKYDKCIVMTHSNFSRIHHTASTSPLTEELLEVMDLFTEYNVNLVITGHDHRNNVSSLGNTDYIILDAVRDDEKQTSYLLLQKDGSNLKYDFIKF